MAGELFTGDDLPEHPLLTKAAAQGAASLTALAGYIGPSTRDGYVRVYPTLDDLTQFVEVARSDIDHAMEEPESELPHGAVKVWLKSDAEIEIHRVETAGTKAAVDSGKLEVARGRLRITIGEGLRANVCQSRCTVCTSRCQVCQSRCSAGRLDVNPAELGARFGGIR